LGKGPWINGRTARALALAAQLGTAVAASLGLAIGGGLLLDRWLKTWPVFLLLGIAVGLLASWYTIASLARELPGQKKRNKEHNLKDE
jgi:F0F1-type ATP synthase assembly protein I